MILRGLLDLAKKGGLIPRFRGFIYGLTSREGSTKSTIYKPLIFTKKCIRWEDGLWIFKNCRIEAVMRYLGVDFDPCIIIHKNVSIQQNCHITCAEHIEIGANTAIANNVTITDIDHPYQDISVPIERQPLVTKPVIIGKDCKLYNNSVILQGTSIGNHCVVGANSVVKGNFPDYSIIAGVPARIIRRYNSSDCNWDKTDSKGNFI